MGEKGDNHTGKVFHSICDGCSDKFRVEERLPKLLLAIVELRRQNGSKEQNQIPAVSLATA